VAEPELGGENDFTMQPSTGDGLQFFPHPYSDSNSYEMGSGSYEGNYGDPSVPQGQRYITPNSNGAPSGGFEDEPPLLEELGINLTHIRMKTLSVLNPFSSISADVVADCDLAGPLMFCMALGSFLLLSGKIHFGYIYGIGTCGCLAIYIILNLMSENGIDIHKTASVLGYCLLPMVLLAGLAVVINMNAVMGYTLAFLSIAWCTYSSSFMFVTLLSMKDQRLLVAYPVGLVYTCFALMTVF